MNREAETRLRNMSVQFGKCNFDGKPVDPQELDRVRPVLAPYGPDAEGIFRKDNVGIVYRAFHTTKESRPENQPCVSASGAVITWDGRLDNRSELIHALRGELSSDSTDLSIVTAAYERWGTDSFAKLIGDWAVSIWNPRTQSLVLAKDFVGARHLYYSVEKDEVTWCTILDPLVLFAGRSFMLEDEYIAGWLSSFPAPHLTPYVGIHSVTPSSFVCFVRGPQKVSKYWDFDPAKRIRYRSDCEYEEHFRSVFLEAVRRRLRSDSPVLAELSGGMDSSSIVCAADTILGCGISETPRLDTVSYYNDSEPNWNERPYFTKIEEKRGRAGCHIDVEPQESLRFEFESEGFAATPASLRRTNQATKQFATYMNSRGNRVVLSGIGGDEVMGGIPTPTPEIADLLARARFRALIHQLTFWALNKRKPWFHLLSEAMTVFLPPALIVLPRNHRPAAWLRRDFVRRNRAAVTGYPSRVKLLGPLPSFQENIATLDGLRRQLACFPLPVSPPHENRYPYLDRHLLEFIYAVPREQLVRPGHRRSLMRRALVGIVPDAILNRARKAFVARAPITAMSSEQPILAEMSRRMASSSRQIIDAKAFCQALQDASHGQEVSIVALTRTLVMEAWLKGHRNTDAPLLAARPAEFAAGPVTRPTSQLG
jgi:asparagine synthase (glutamine-hydrolysing)